ncbi:ABC transporter substrate-binding protein [Microbacterium sp. No. 7]|uniref:ABC transporter substrate-binding protein n=1 Tax=Microbacterium sp. No. 7 TaxID=1714373 RepID=UPI0006D02352|nr:ABC transporter substrate-binding protein [Microbacterium sp. No. 7]ALJ18952.1 hypothetical protein AOA12_03135 [Microbacterium sp. No. 7]
MTRTHTARRATAFAGLALGAALALTACGSSTPASGDEAAADGTSSAAATEGFPVTLDTAYGEITVDEKPQKIVALSASYVDALAAMGVETVAFSAGVADEAAFAASFPWLEGVATGPMDPALVNAEYQPVLEAIAKYDPDLILANTWQVDEDLYTQISSIAPTFVGVTLGNNDWNVTLDAIGELIGEPDAADAAAAKVEEAYAAASAGMPGLEGKTYQSVGYDGTKFWFGNGSWLDGFGLVPAENQDNTQSGNGTNDISLENIDQLSADVLSIWFWQSDPAVLGADPRYQQLPAVKNEAVLVPDLALANATNGAGPLSLAWAIDWVTEQLSGTALAKG